MNKGKEKLQIESEGNDASFDAFTKDDAWWDVEDGKDDAAINKESGNWRKNLNFHVLFLESVQCQKVLPITAAATATAAKGSGTLKFYHTLNDLLHN